MNLSVKGGKHFKEVSMGGHIVNYDSMLVLTHFKGHAMGGFGGSMKNIAIGCADGAGSCRFGCESAVGSVARQGNADGDDGRIRQSRL